MSKRKTPLTRSAAKLRNFVVHLAGGVPPIPVVATSESAAYDAALKVFHNKLSEVGVRNAHTINPLADRIEVIAPKVSF